MIHKNDLNGFVREIEFRWLVSMYDRKLQYRVRKGDGFRGWGDWQDVKEEAE